MVKMPTGTAPELRSTAWVGPEGTPIAPVRLAAFEGKFKVVYCFQSWCPGCHSKGLPDLKKMVDALKGNDEVVFLAVQTVFEGHDQNTYAKMLEVQKQYDLAIPFGHDAGADGTSMSTLMEDYQTGGTPWFLLIDQKNRVVFSDFHINPEAAIDVLKQIK